MYNMNLEYKDSLHSHSDVDTQETITGCSLLSDFHGVRVSTRYIHLIGNNANNYNICSISSRRCSLSFWHANKIRTLYRYEGKKLTLDTEML